MVSRFALPNLILVARNDHRKASFVTSALQCVRTLNANQVKAPSERSPTRVNGRWAGGEKDRAAPPARPSWASRGFEVDLLLRELAKQRVGFLLFLERLLQERRRVFQAELRRPGL